MIIAFRADASLLMGSGHVMRCLTLADALKAQGVECHFICQEHPGHLLASIQQRGHVATALPPCTFVFKTTTDQVPQPAHAAWLGCDWQTDAHQTGTILAALQPNWLIVDHYALDQRWETAVRPYCKNILVIDDLADRPHDCDWLLDQNCGRQPRDYAEVVPAKCRLLIGPRFALLAPTYSTAPRHAFHRELRSIGIFMGGTDAADVSSTVLDICRRDVGFKGNIEVVSTSVNPHLADLRKACTAWPATSLTLDLPDLTEFFARHDLQIGAGGGATWERCCIGAPTVAIAVAGNQSMVVTTLARLGALKAAYLTKPGKALKPDLFDGPDAMPFAHVLRELLAAPDVRRRMAETATELVDGFGTKRVALSLLRDDMYLRSATVNDVRLLHGWRNHPAVRSVSLQADEIAYEDHNRWMLGVLDDPTRRLLIAQVGNYTVGCIRFDYREHNNIKVSLYLDPTLLGLGLGSRMLLAGERLMGQHAIETFTISAKVLQGNTASQQLFVVCGYSGGPLSYQKTVKIQR